MELSAPETSPSRELHPIKLERLGSAYNDLLQSAAVPKDERVFAELEFRGTVVSPIEKRVVGPTEAYRLSLGLEQAVSNFFGVYEDHTAPLSPHKKRIEVTVIRADGTKLPTLVVEP